MCSHSCLLQLSAAFLVWVRIWPAACSWVPLQRSGPQGSLEKAWPVLSLSYRRAWESGDDDKGTVICTAGWRSATKSPGRICKGPLPISEPASAISGVFQVDP